MKINLKNRVQIILLMSITIPGFILGYLSLKTIKSEKTLIEKSLITHREDFLTYFEKVIKKSETEKLSELKDIFIQSSRTSGLNNNFDLLTDVLNLDMVEGALILRDKKLLMPSTPLNSIPGITAPSIITPVMKVWINDIQKLFRTGRYRECIRAIDRFSQLTAHYLIRPMDNPIKTGFKVMKLNCYKYLGLENKTINFGTNLITELLKFSEVTNYTGAQYYLQEVLNTLTSMENLSKEGRDNLWKISLQSKLFFSNVKFVHGKWQPNIEFISQIKDKEINEGLEIFYIEGEPYIRVKFPYISRN